MSNIENPAAQLLRMVESMRAKDGGKNALDVLAEVFEVSPGHSIVIAQQMISTAELCRIAQMAIEKHIFGNKDLYLAPFQKVESLVHNINLNTLWKHYQARLSDTLVTELKFADHFLENAIASESSEKSVVAADLISKLDKLLEDCLDSELDPKIQELFATHLQKLRAALINYRIYGDEALQKILDETVGSIHRHSTEIKAQSEKGREFISFVFDAIGKMNDLVSSTDSVAKLATAATVYFLPLLS